MLRPSLASPNDAGEAVFLLNHAKRVIESGGGDGIVLALTLGGDVVYESAAGIPRRDRSLAKSAAQRILRRLGWS